MIPDTKSFLEHNSRFKVTLVHICALISFQYQVYILKTIRILRNSVLYSVILSLTIFWGEDVESVYWMLKYSQIKNVHCFIHSLTVIVRNGHWINSGSGRQYFSTQFMIRSVFELSKCHVVMQARCSELPLRHFSLYTSHLVEKTNPTTPRRHISHVNSPSTERFVIKSLFLNPSLLKRPVSWCLYSNVIYSLVSN